MWRAVKPAIWWCSGRGKASLLWLMVGYVYFKRRGVPLLWSYSGFRRKGVASASWLPDFIVSYIFPSVGWLMIWCFWLKLLPCKVWIPVILTRIPVFRFFKELEERHQLNIMIDDISDIVCKHAQSNFDPYVTYCSNEVYQQRTLQRLVWVTAIMTVNTHKCMFLSYLSWIWASMTVLILWTRRFALLPAHFFPSFSQCIISSSTFWKTSLPPSSLSGPRIQFLRRCWPG